jgi:cardiolipin synthase
MRRWLPLLFVSTVALAAPPVPQSGKVVGAIKTAARAPSTFASGLSNSLHATFGHEFGGFSRALHTAKQLPDERLQKMPDPVLANLANTLRRPGLFSNRTGAGEQFVRVVTAHGREPGQVMGVLSRLGIYEPAQLPKTVTGPARDELTQLMSASKARPGDWTGFHQFASDATGTRERPGKVDLLIDGSRYYPAMEQSIDGAKKSVLAVEYAFHSDDGGWEVAEKMGAAAKRGVFTETINDRVGSMASDRALFRYLGASGVHNEMVASGRALGGHIEHKKIIVVDGKEAYIGGMNLGSEYRDRWHDVQSRVTGPVIADMTRTLVGESKQLGQKVPRGVRKDARASDEPAPADGGVRLVVHEGFADQSQKVLYLRAIDTSTKRILIENPYMADRDVIGHLEAAAQRGVRVVVIVPNRSDNKLLKAAARSQYRALLDAGVETYEYIGKDPAHPQMAHGKVAVFDDDLTTIGSTNLDGRSLRNNNEANLWVRDPHLATRVAGELFDVDMTRSQRIREYNPTRMQRLEDGLARRLANKL